ncbi:MAG: glycerol-3-phosphate acyltransferase [Asgard group archaeon]|nr:glycerol-3-phosphate acyltransferase [Asgard group archaeon]
MAAINILWIVLACIGAYFLGSIPFSVWIGKLAKGVDLRKHNVKNPGGMNAVMTYGHAIGIPILLLDFFKGTLTIALLDHIFSIEYFVAGDGSNIWYTLAVFLGPMFCILGHNYPIWLKFDGGQGLGVFMGVMLYLNPILFTFYSLGMIFIMLVVKIKLRYGTMLVIILDILLALFMQINPPWSKLPYNKFSIIPSFIQLKLALILTFMFLLIFIRALQAMIEGKKTASWTVSASGEQQYKD